MIQKKSDFIAATGNQHAVEQDWQGEEWPYSEASSYCDLETSKQGLELPPTQSLDEKVSPTVRGKTSCETAVPKFELALVPENSTAFPERKERNLRKTLKSLALAFSVGIISALLLAQNASNKLTLAMNESYHTLPQTELRQKLVSNLEGEALAQHLGTHNLSSSLGAILLKEASERKDERLSKVLAALTDSSNRQTRVQSLRALRKPFHLAQPVAIRAILDRMQWDKDLLIRGYAAKIVARSEHKGALDILKRQLRVERSSFVAALLIRELQSAKKAAKH